ncbi:hypothetical protein BGZ80_004860 [Entomortierella chlamydospora]|uniref:Uncharacterized protein n=1 Tax=Entomortierella chlamydospora TaxID=101097 RepID=A0A9P6MM57_9FUNG|nr:hypothetical protein BGZ80_004860 [Entomortierella chlamydospora]
MPLTSDSEPTMYSNQKGMHYSRPSNGPKHNGSGNHPELENSRSSSGTRSSSSSGSSANGGQTLNNKTSNHALNGGNNSKGGRTASPYTGHQSNGSNISLSQGRGTAPGSQERIRSATHDSGYSNDAHSWPILFAILPPLGALVFGKSEIFSDILTLTLIAFFLYNIIKVPWELYHAARTRRVLLTSVSANAAPLDPVLEARRQNAAASLRRQEFFSLLLVLASPFLGGYTLQYLKSFFSSYEDYLSALNIELFIIASAIRPLTHLVSLLKSRALHLQEQVHYPDTDVEILKRKVASVESELAQLRRAVATKRDVQQVQEDVEPTLHQLSKHIKRHDKKETLLRTYAEERFASIDEKLREYDTILAYRLTEEQHRSSLLFLPINILVAMLGYCTFFIPQRLAGITGSKQQPMLKSSPTPAAIGDGAANEANYDHGKNLQHHITKASQLSGRQPSHNPITSTRETPRLY